MKQVKPPEERHNFSLIMHQSESCVLNNMEILLEKENISFYKVKVDHLMN